MICSLKARLVVQGFTGQRLGKIPTCSPTVIPSISSDFPNTCCVTWFSNSQRRREVCISSRGLDEQHEDDNDDCNIESAQPVSDTFCEPGPELSRKLQLEHHQCVRMLKAVCGLVNAPGRCYHRVATDLRNMRGEGNLACGLSETKTASFMLCVWCMLMTSCWRAVTLHWENMSLMASTICVNGELGSHECSHSAAHEPHRPTTKKTEHGADLRPVSQNTRKKCRSSPCHHIDAETENPK